MQIKSIVLSILLFIFTSSNIMAQWIKTNGPSGSSGSVISMAANNNFIFAVSNGSVYRSADKGKSWLRLYSNNKTNTSVTSIALNSSYIYIGTQESKGGYGVYQSSDNGSTWFPNKTEITPTSPAIVYALGVYDSVILAASQFGGGSIGMFRSTDFGNNWLRVKPNGVKCYASQGSNIFAAVANETADPFGVYFSDDLGATWTSTNLPHIKTYSVAVKENIVFAGTDSAIYKSTDNGASWNRVDSSVTHVSALIFNESGSYVFAGTYNGLLRSSDSGETWEITDKGLNSNRI
jgi:photosystem II stability/assembly factor-like uncharacterized protein